MIVRSRQPLRSEARSIATAMIHATDALVARRQALLAVALGFFCFMPYAAIPVGNRSAIQLGNIVTLAILLPALFLPYRSGHRAFVFLLVLMAPLCLSTAKAGLSGGGSLELSIKTMILW